MEVTAPQTPGGRACVPPEAARSSGLNPHNEAERSRRNETAPADQISRERNQVNMPTLTAAEGTTQVIELVPDYRPRHSLDVSIENFCPIACMRATAKLLNQRNANREASR